MTFDSAERFVKMMNATQDYWDRLSRISKNTDSRLYRTDHQSIHSTTYNILVFNRENPFVRIKCETLSMMEVVR